LTANPIYIDYTACVHYQEGQMQTRSLRLSFILTFQEQ